MTPDPREFPCMDDDPRNNGWGYQSHNPYDNYETEEELEDIKTDEETITDEDFRE